MTGEIHLNTNLKWADANNPLGLGGLHLLFWQYGCVPIICKNMLTVHCIFFIPDIWSLHIGIDLKTISHLPSENQLLPFLDSQLFTPHAPGFVLFSPCCMIFVSLFSFNFFLFLSNFRPFCSLFISPHPDDIDLYILAPWGSSNVKTLAKYGIYILFK
jgi:hypothetical protein